MARTDVPQNTVHEQTGILLSTFCKGIVAKLKSILTTLVQTLPGNRYL